MKNLEQEQAAMRLRHRSYRKEYWKLRYESLKRGIKWNWSAHKQAVMAGRVSKTRRYTKRRKRQYSDKSGIEYSPMPQLPRILIPKIRHAVTWADISSGRSNS